MPSAVKLRQDYSAEALRALARRSKDVNQSRRLYENGQFQAEALIQIEGPEHFSI